MPTLAEPKTVKAETVGARCYDLRRARSQAPVHLLTRPNRPQNGSWMHGITHEGLQVGVGSVPRT